MKASVKQEAMGKVKLIVICDSEIEAKVIGLELINAIGVLPDMIEDANNVTEWDTKQFITDVKEQQ